MVTRHLLPRGEPDHLSPRIDPSMQRVTERGSFRAPSGATLARRGSKSTPRDRGAKDAARATEEAPHLLAAAPIVAVRDELERQVSDLRRLAPTSDATTALAEYLGKLVQAVEDARDLELFITADAAAVILGKSPSMVTYLCRTGALQAKKVGGTWQILRKDLEAMQRGGRKP